MSRVKLKLFGPRPPALRGLGGASSSVSPGWGASLPPAVFIYLFSVLCAVLLCSLTFLFAAFPGLNITLLLARPFGSARGHRPVGLDYASVMRTDGHNRNPLSSHE